jgi:hypothetical protein
MEHLICVLSHQAGPQSLDCSLQRNHRLHHLQIQTGNLHPQLDQPRPVSPRTLEPCPPRDPVTTSNSPLGVVSATPLGTKGWLNRPMGPRGDRNHPQWWFGGGFGHPLGSMGVVEPPLGAQGCG